MLVQRGKIVSLEHDKTNTRSDSRKRQSWNTRRVESGTVEAETTRHRRNPVVAINKSERAAGTAVNSEDEDNSCRRSRTDEDIKWRPTSVNSVAAHVHPKRPGISFFTRNDGGKKRTGSRIGVSRFRLRITRLQQHLLVVVVPFIANCDKSNSKKEF